MKAILSFLLAVLFVATLSQVAFAQGAPEGGSGMGPGPGKEITPEQFNQIKTRILKRMDERRARLDQEKACVQAANNAAELRKCRPEPPMMGPGGRGGQFQRGQGQGRPPMEPMEKAQ